MKAIWIALVGLFGLAGAIAGDVDTAVEILRNINTPRDVRVAFVERRGNALLTEPLVLTGSVIFSADGELSKIINGPMRESVVITPDRIRLERDGQVRELPIGRQKGAREFYLGLSALLDGDLDTVADLFEITATRDDNNHWRIELVPRKQRMKKFVERMDVFGTGSTITRIRTVQSAEDWQELIFDPVAQE